MIDIIKEHIEYRYQILKLAWFDVVKEYKGTVLGWLWSVVKPASIIFVFWFAFTFGLRAGANVEGFPFIVWLVSGLIPWFFMQDMLNKGINAMRKNNPLVTKIKFPISVIPTFDTIAHFIPHLFLMLIFFFIYIIVYGIDIYFIQLPLYMLVMFLYFNTLSLGMSLLAVISKDFMNLVKSFTTAIFWLSGIIWNIQSMNIEIVNKILLFNPVTFFAEGYRNSFIHKEWFFSDMKVLVCFLIVFVATFIFSMFIYRRTRYEVGDVI